MDKPTVTLRYAQALMQAAERLGLPAGAPLPVAERVPLAEQDRLWQHLCQNSPDPLIGLQLGLSLQVGHLDVAGMLLMSSETLGQAFQDLIEYMPIIGEGGDLLLDPKRGVLSYQAHYTLYQDARIESVMAGILHLSRWASGGRFQARSLAFKHAPLDDPQRYPGLLGCPVEFQATSNRLEFDPQQFALPLIQANARLREDLARLADAQLARLGERSLAAELSTLIRLRPSASKEDHAAQLALSGRHLTRKLADLGLSYKALRDRELKQLAQLGLREGEKIAALAVHLGFSDESAFAKAFRRWTGQSPAQFREQE